MCCGIFNKDIQNKADCTYVCIKDCMAEILIARCFHIYTSGFNYSEYTINHNNSVDSMCTYLSHHHLL